MSSPYRDTSQSPSNKPSRLLSAVPSVDPSGDPSIVPSYVKIMNKYRAPKEQHVGSLQE